MIHFPSTPELPSVALVWRKPTASGTKPSAQRGSLSLPSCSRTNRLGAPQSTLDCGDRDVVGKCHLGNRPVSAVALQEGGSIGFGQAQHGANDASSLLLHLDEIEW